MLGQQRVRPSVSPPLTLISVLSSPLCHSLSKSSNSLSLSASLYCMSLCLFLCLSLSDSSPCLSFFSFTDTLFFNVFPCYLSYITISLCTSVLLNNLLGEFGVFPMKHTIILCPYFWGWPATLWSWTKA